MTQKQFVIVLIITFIVILIWIISDIAHARPSESLSPKVKTLMDPVTPTFDKAILDQVKNTGILEPFKEASKSARIESTTSSKLK